jgi:hypothetical protein
MTLPHSLLPTPPSQIPRCNFFPSFIVLIFYTFAFFNINADKQYANEVYHYNRSDAIIAFITKLT